MAEDEDYRELVIGENRRRRKLIVANAHEEWINPTYMNMAEPGRDSPDVTWDLETFDLMPFAPDTFNEIHAYEVLEHCGRQGDWRLFFSQFSDFWRILKPNGYFCATCPSLTNIFNLNNGGKMTAIPTPAIWLWGDPGHSRVIQPQTLVFLDQAQYTAQVGITPMSDYRAVYRADFVKAWEEMTDHSYRFALMAIKPSRISLPPPPLRVGMN